LGDGMASDPKTGEEEVGSAEVAGIKLSVRVMSVRDIRDSEEVSAPVGRCSGVKGANVGADRACGVSTGHDRG
jgi:hypothetical protein